MSLNIGSQLISKLGSPDSKIPLAAKDIFNIGGYTYFSYDAGGSLEGKDRLVDEVGTGLIWLFGIPLYKKLIDNTIFKAAKINPDVDVRVIKSKDYFASAVENAPTKEILNDLKKAAKNVNKTKGLTFLRFILSLGLTMASYFALTKFKQNMTKKSIEKEFLKKQAEENNKKSYSNFKMEKNPVFDEIENKINKSIPSFKSSSIVGIAEEFMLNPVKNMIILDAGISASRIKNARTKGERTEYAIKEGSFLFFIYCAGKIIKSGIDKVCEKLLKIPVALDAKLLSSQTAINILENENINQEINNFSDLLKMSKNKKEIYDFIFKNPDNIIVKAAKDSGIISTIKDSENNIKIDTRKFIDIKEIKNLINNINSFINNSGQDKVSYLNKVKSLKVLTTILNIAICCFALGYVVPKEMYNYRKKHQNGKNDFHVKVEYEKELKSKQTENL